MHPRLAPVVQAHDLPVFRAYGGGGESPPFTPLDGRGTTSGQMTLMRPRGLTYGGERNALARTLSPWSEVNLDRPLVAKSCGLCRTNSNPVFEAIRRRYMSIATIVPPTPRPASPFSPSLFLVPMFGSAIGLSAVGSF